MGMAVLISIRPRWCELIAIGKKTVEVRKTAPKLPTPYKSYIYETIDSKYENIGIHDPDAPIYKTFVHHPGKVIGEYLCDDVEAYAMFGRAGTIPRYMRRTPGGFLATEIHFPNLQMSPNDLDAYGKGKPLYGLNIGDLVIYDKPKELSEFRSWNTGVVFKDGYPMPTHEIKRPPQSFMYVEEL